MPSSTPETRRVRGATRNRQLATDILDFVRCEPSHTAEEIADRFELTIGRAKSVLVGLQTTCLVRRDRTLFVEKWEPA